MKRVFFFFNSTDATAFGPQIGKIGRVSFIFTSESDALHWGAEFISKNDRQTLKFLSADYEEDLLPYLNSNDKSHVVLNLCLMSLDQLPAELCDD